MHLQFEAKQNGTQISATFNIYAAADDEGHLQGILTLQLVDREEEFVDHVKAWTIEDLKTAATNKAIMYLRDTLAFTTEFQGVTP